MPRRSDPRRRMSVTARVGPRRLPAVVRGRRARVAPRRSPCRAPGLPPAPYGRGHPALFPAAGTVARTGTAAATRSGHPGRSWGGPIPPAPGHDWAPRVNAKSWRKAWPQSWQRQRWTCGTWRLPPVQTGSASAGRSARSPTATWMLPQLGKGISKVRPPNKVGMLRGKGPTQICPRARPESNGGGGRSRWPLSSWDGHARWAGARGEGDLGGRETKEGGPAITPTIRGRSGNWGAWVVRTGALPYPPHGEG